MACLIARAVPRVANAPDGIRAVIGYQQRSILSHGDTDRPSPDMPIVDYEAGEKVFVLAVGTARLVQRHANYFVSGAHRPVPRTVLGGKNASLILCRELRAFIEHHL